ncbi:DUF86 domain-containing protein [Caldibacillus lycopersici]|uniref:DUF86 domain-containing protein n=1 Tax=Perspicuibacillus lycopersici TaxID=1325689 RepID=A0AAE3IU30_9BACI|nr:DUF86 domain-containing protein [Perspicuibacillus lycopersici]MCU9612824.1 DUF86 domain-containing protein [Perspicuibacillus lycopersici]
MYFVDREKIEDTLTFMDMQMQTFHTITDLHDEFQKLALERVVHTMIESVLDVGNAMIDGFIMRDPGSYDDIIDILLDEKVINEDMAIHLKKIILLRKDLVQHYISVDHKKIYETVQQEWTSVEKFPERIRNYLINELGPVSAFRN